MLIEEPNIFHEFNLFLRAHFYCNKNLNIQKYSNSIQFIYSEYINYRYNGKKNTELHLPESSSPILGYLLHYILCQIIRLKYYTYCSIVYYLYEFQETEDFIYRKKFLRFYFSKVFSPGPGIKCLCKILINFNNISLFI